jgi:hypothetical protein
VGHAGRRAIMTMRLIGPLAWRTRMREHGDLVLGLGLLGDLQRDHRRWTYFLEHGYDHDSGWKPELLPAEQRKLLLAYLRDHIPAAQRTGLTRLIATLATG